MEGTNNLNQLIYTSAAGQEISPTEVEQILLVARAKNAQLGVTGMLLFSMGTFFQVLEGSATTLKHLFASISNDQRHNQVTVIINEPIAKRAFADWSMGYAEISAEELAALPGLNDFFTGGRSLDAVQPGRAKKLLAAFAQGRWRAKLAKSVHA